MDVREDIFDLKKTCFALVDANNFYVSCERVFNHKLCGVPAIVLSNNDGCAIARSDEVKALGIEMGTPLFQIQHLIKKHNIHVMSANFALYGDISERIIDILIKVVPEVTVYSIDESFLDLKGFASVHEIENICVDIVKKIYRYVGIPVSIGVSSTKTLAKIANKVVKKNKMPSHVYILKSRNQVEKILKETYVADVWGVGRRWSKNLQIIGIRSAYDLMKCEVSYIQKKYNIVLARTVCELQGVSCIDVESSIQKKSIMVSRSFGETQSCLNVLNEAIATFTAKAAEKLRAQNSVANSLIVTMHTKPVNKVGLNYRNSMSARLPHPTSDSMLLIKYAKSCSNKIFLSGCKYKKVGILLMDIKSVNSMQMDMFFERKIQCSDKLMQAIDAINKKMGASSISFLAQGTQQRWKMKQERLSGISLSNPRFLPIVHCKD